MLGCQRLFTARDEEDGQAYDAVHFAEMIAALGPPPAEFLAKNPERRADFWGEKGMLTVWKSLSWFVGILNKSRRMVRVGTHPGRQNTRIRGEPARKQREILEVHTASSDLAA